MQEKEHGLWPGPGLRLCQTCGTFLALNCLIYNLLGSSGVRKTHTWASKLRGWQFWCRGIPYLQERPSPAGEADRAAEGAVDERVDGAVQGRQVLNDHGGVEALLGVWKEAEIVQHVEEEVRTPTADEGCGEESRERHSGPRPRVLSALPWREVQLGCP